MEAQRFPDDFDGIIAGAPANAWSHHFTGFVWNEQALMKDASSMIPPGKLPAIQAAALKACDRLDGVSDGLIEEDRCCIVIESAILSLGHALETATGKAHGNGKEVLERRVPIEAGCRLQGNTMLRPIDLVLGGIELDSHCIFVHP